uniref:Chromophore lyase CpcS/CpeS n=1 Tax=Gelidium elegans TaxID=37200 RepID=A0A141SDE9_GELEL|nr:hypothetical protein Gele_056 [Gelidium elegans]AMK96317.1 hypothetical protein Gele_056 [Gelidium elegans]
MFNLNKFFEKIQGKWYSHQTIYFVSNKKVKNYRNIITLNTNYFKENKLNQYNPYDIIHEEFIDDTLFYSYTILNSNCIKILSKSSEDNINYIEYIYSINQNFRISITYLKDLQRCLAVSFNSYIRQPHCLN